jgi:RNA polymerase sigma-70 factor (ECF subfamily)
MTARILPFAPVLAASSQAPRGRLGRAVGSLLGPAKPRDPAVASGPMGPREVERFRTLVLPHLDAAYGFARYLCRDATVADDLVQDAYLRAYRGFAGYRGGDPKAWLLAIVRSSFLSWARSQRAWSEITTPAAVETVESAPSDAPDPEQSLLKAADAEGVRRAVEALPDPFRETLVLRELQEMSYREIAEITGAPIGTVMSRLARARSLLIAALKGEGAPA